jgi:release factor glutamine methyltransferase
MRPAEVVARGARYLERHGVESAEANAEQLMMTVLGVDRAGVFGSDRPLTATEAKAFGRALCRRCTGTPLQHITGSAGFRGLNLLVRRGVFVPRPETEILVEEALARVARKGAPVVVDACTGAGAIALAIAAEHPGARVLATDLSPEAVSLASENARLSALDVELSPGDLLDPVPVDLRGRVDLVTCNPPYVPESRRGELSPEVAAEPDLALYGEDEIYRRLFAQAAEVLTPGGWVVVEIEETRSEAVMALARSTGLTDVSVRKDLNGRPRVVCARRP